MKLGIVGAEAAKFTDDTELKARSLIAQYIEEYAADEVISGGCHLGGIDEWAIHEAQGIGCGTRIFPPKNLMWSTGYKPRNIEIAAASDVVLCVAVAKYPESYNGMRFNVCYHCISNKLQHPYRDHVKSGGCWTVKYAQKMLGKKGIVEIIV